MKVVLLAVLSLVACASAFVEVESAVGYHDRVAIPMAKKIREAEKGIQATENPNARIVGGGAARPHSHPYLGGVLINYVNRPNIGVCGSVLVSRTRLVTAAHCWYDSIVQASRFVIVLGSKFLFSGGDRIASSKVLTYPGWNPSTQQNNLAIIFLRSPVLLSANIQPIALATNPNETFVGEWAVAAGFGTTSDSQTGVAVLSIVHEVNVQVISVDDCRTAFGSIAQPNTICTSGYGGRGTCRGDGGGPLVTMKDGQPILLGVITFGAASGCEQGHPSGHSRVSSFLDFIRKHM